MEIETSQLLGQAIAAGILWIVYSIIVYFMVKVQKMKVGLLGALVSCFFGIAVSFVPFAGFYLSFPVVVFCLWRFAGPHAFGDSIFTVVISGALMFCFKLYVLGALMGNLGARYEGLVPDPDLEVQAAETEMAVVAETETSEPASQFDWSLVDKEAFALKGITSGAKRQLIMFQYADQMYTLETGESCAVRTKEGTIRVRCESVSRSHVELLLNDQEPFKLSLD